MNITKGDKYLLYEDDSEELHQFGLMHNLSNLKSLISEASATGRIPVITPPRFDPCHNFGVPVHALWEKYVNLNGVEVHPKERNSDGETIQMRDCFRYITLEDFKNVRIPKQKICLAEPNESLDKDHFTDAVLVIRKIPSYCELWANINNDAESRVSIYIPFSQNVEILAASIAAQMGEFSILHVRRTDKIKRNHKIKKYTAPDYILKFLQLHFPKETLFYIMSDEKNRSYFDKIKEHFLVRRYYDFSCLSDLLKNNPPDNYLLFSVEILLYYRYAIRRVSTFIGGEDSLSLSPFSRHEKHMTPINVFSSYFKEYIQKLQKKLKYCLRHDSSTMFQV